MPAVCSSRRGTTGSTKSLSAHFSGPDRASYRLFFESARSGDARMTALLADGLAVNCVGPRGATPLHIAARFGHLPMVQLLLAHGADATLRDNRGQTASSKARACGEMAVVAQLELAAPRASDTALAECRRLFEAAHGGSTQELSALLAANPALLHAVGPRGATALHVAARYGHAAAVELLLLSGADAAAQDNTGHTGLDKALQLGHHAVAALLPGESNERYSAPPAATGAQQFAGASESARMHAEMQTAYREALASATAEPLVLDAVVRDEAELEPTQPTIDGAVASSDDAEAVDEGSADVALWRPDGSEMHLAEPSHARREADGAGLLGTSGVAAGSYLFAPLGHTSADAPVTIGRRAACDVQLNDPEVSGQHAQVWHDGGKVYAADKPGSFNGTYLRLSAEKEPSEPYPLQAGDAVIVGPHTLTLEPSDDGAHLVVRHSRDADFAPMRRALTPQPMSIGRRATCAVTLNDPLVSGVHAEVALMPNGWSVADVGSSNGTFVRLSAERQPSRHFEMWPGQSLVFGTGPTASELALCRAVATVAERRGRRSTMEDAHVMVQRLPPPVGVAGEHWPSISFAAVYDGHGGAEAADFARQHLHRQLVRHLGERLASDGDGAAVRAADLPLSALCAAMHDAFMSTDAELMSTTTHMSGTTAVAALLTRSHLVVANAGDSRACLLRDGRVLALSIDHKPDRRDETERINAAGGFVSHGRILHGLAVSRAIGDREYKLDPSASPTSPGDALPFTADLVIAEPEVRACRVEPGDEVLLACDGLWDVLTAEAAFDFLHQHQIGHRLAAVQELVAAAEEQYHSTDNITALYMRL